MVTGEQKSKMLPSIFASSVIDLRKSGEHGEHFLHGESLFVSGAVFVAGGSYFRMLPTCSPHAPQKGGFAPQSFPRAFYKRIQIWESID